MKSLKAVSIFFSLFSLIFIFPSCAADPDCEEASDDPINQTRNVTGFNKIEVDGDIDVNISIGTEGATVIAAENHQAFVSTSVSGGTLLINVDGDRCLLADQPVRVDVTVSTNLNGIKNTGSGTVTGTALSSLNVLEVDNDGKGVINLSGAGNTVNVDNASEGEIRMYNFYAFNTNATQNGSGRVEVRVIDGGVLDARINDIGFIYYKGIPATVNQSGSGSGELVNAN